MADSGNDKLDHILKRMLETPPLSEAELSARLKAEREAKKQVREESDKRRKAKNLGQWI